MNLRTVLAQVLGVVAIAAALAFAPSAAQAHAGHHHTGSAPIAAALVLPVLAVSVDRLSMPFDQSAHDQTAHDQALHDHDGAELRAAPDSVPAGDRAACNQNCCCSAPCHSSTACTLGQDLSIVLPHDAGVSLRAWNVLGIALCDPEGIRKPPKSVA